MWLHTPDPQFREKVADVMGLYVDPPMESGRLLDAYAAALDEPLEDPLDDVDS